MLRRLAFALAATLLCACADIPEHEVDVVVDYEGHRFHGVVRFASHDDEIQGGDDSCSLFSGNCGQRTTTVGELVSGDLPLERAVLEGDGEFHSYDFFLRRSPPDRAAVDTSDRAQPWRPSHRFTCTSYSSSLGEPGECWGTTKTASIVVTVRD